MKNLIKWLQDNELDFDNDSYNQSEIIIPIPCDCVPLDKYGKRLAREIIYDSDTLCWTDEAYLHVTKNKDGISLLIEIPNFEKNT